MSTSATASSSSSAQIDPAQLRAWDAEQATLAARVVVLPDDHDDTRSPPTRFTHVGGLDISFVDKEEEGSPTSQRALACLVVLSFPALELVYEDVEATTLTLPYVSGYLAFREAPVLVRLVERLRARRPELLVGLALMVDGNGVLHPRGCGLACHVGLATGLPAIGVAKTFLHVDGLDTHGVRRAIDEETEATAADDDDDRTSTTLPLVGRSGRIWGVALRPAGVKNPVFVSVGTGLSLAAAVAVARACCRHRVPEPIRQADIRSRARIREEGASLG